MKLPNTKSIRKIISKDIKDSYRIKVISSIFKDINIVTSLVQNTSLFSPSSCINKKTIQSSYSKTIEFLNEIIEYFNDEGLVGENIVAKRLLGVSSYTLNDTANMYYNYLERKEALNLREISLNMPLNEMHDTLSRMNKRMNKQNTILEYTEEEMKLCSTIEGYEIGLAKDTFELIDIGEEMSICVGGYDWKAVARKNKDKVLSYGSPCGIAYIRKDNEYVACIELDENLKIINQLKGKRNTRVKNELLIVIMKWKKENELISNTVDLPLDEEFSEIIKKIYNEVDEVNNVELNLNIM
jgi:hypothetical protein